MIPTVEQVRTRFRALLDDPAGLSFTDAVFTEAFGESFDALFNAFLQAQVPRIQIIQTATLPPSTTSLTPDGAGIADFADIDELEERLAGSTEDFTEVERVDKLTQRSQVDRLLEFVWRFDTFYFVGATTQRELRLTYESSGTAPAAGSIAVDGCLTFLSKAAVAACGWRKGYDEIAAQCRLEAYGPRYNEGVIGGLLFMLVQPRVRSMQNVQIAPRPYSVSARKRIRRIPYVAAQQPAGVGVGPVQFTNVDGTLTGTIDGSNATFFLTYPVATAEVSLNGSDLIRNSHYTHGANVITFIAPFIPQAGAEILVRGWL